MDDLAMASGVTPADRADRARNVLAAYPDGENGDVETLVGDLIADLLHLLDDEGVENPTGVLSTGELHWSCEREGDEEDDDEDDGPASRQTMCKTCHLDVEGYVGGEWWHDRGGNPTGSDGHRHAPVDD